MNKLEEISHQRKKSHQSLVSLKSKVYESFLEMERATYADGALPKKTKELIAIGISVLMDCESCMQWHIDQAATTFSLGAFIVDGTNLNATNVSATNVTVGIRTREQSK